MAIFKKIYSQQNADKKSDIISINISRIIIAIKFRTTTDFPWGTDDDSICQLLCLASGEDSLVQVIIPGLC